MRYIIILIILMSFDVSHSQICVGTQGQVQWEVWRGLYADLYSELSALEFYPDRPDVTNTLYSLSAPVNYDNYFGAKISGFIKVPVNDSISFNITGNSRFEFLLSTDANPQNLVLRAFGNESTNEYEHTKFPQQTSPKLWLQAVGYYYFEIRYVESTGSDHCKLFWKNSFVSSTSWNIISANYIYNVGCKPALCPERGTPCDDNNANTINDLQDGHCNCVGKPSTMDTCVGTANTIRKLSYDNIPGSTINDLYSGANFPGIPYTSASLPVFGTRSESQKNNEGNLVNGYLSVPVTGNYKFNVTGDDMTILFISSDEKPINKQAHQVLVSGWTGTTEHNKYIYQSTSNLYLQAGKYYYIELNHKEGTGSEHFGVFWQTPFTEPNTWKRIPSFYMYDFGCGIACIPQGTPCDDGNEFTNNDQYNDQCQCVGTPCSGPDCNSPIASYVPYEKCNVTDQLSNKPSNNWLSCQPSINPNPLNTVGHWIKYDLGKRHRLISSQIWNYNVLNETSKGFQAVKIDYSEDGNTWTHLNNYIWPLASGEVGYGGFSGPNFNEINARYVLITSLGDPNICHGLGKVAFKAVNCPTEGTLCDDKNPMTILDKYNGNCECIGQNLLINECDETNLELGALSLQTDVYSASQNISAISIIDPNSFVGFVGGESIVLSPGFEAKSEAVFVASINPCTTNNVISEITDRSKTLVDIQQHPEKKLLIVPVPESDMIDIHFKIDQPGAVLLKIKSTNSAKEYIITDHKYIDKGYYRKRIRSKKLAGGVHSVTLVTAESSAVEKLVVDKNDVEK